MADNSSQFQRFDGTEDVIKSAFRTLTVFEFFADIQQDASISEMMDALNIPQSSLSVLVRFLSDMGYLVYNPDKRTYYPTLRLHYLSAWRSQKNPAAANIQTALQDLQHQTQQTVVLSMRNRLYSQYIMVEHAGGIMRDHVETGSLRPLVCSATGWSLLASETENEIQKLIHKTQVLTKNETWKSTAASAGRHIDFVRKNGYAYSKGESTNGASGLAMSIPTQGDKPRLSLAVAGPHAKISHEKQVILNSMDALISNLPPTITEDILETASFDDNES